VNWDGLNKSLQIAAAALGIPVALGGSYSVYRTYFSTEIACQNLRGRIIATMEKNVAPEAKRTLLAKDVGEFLKDCGDADPDAKRIFEAAMAPQAERPRDAQGPTVVAAAGPGGPGAAWRREQREQAGEAPTPAVPGVPATWRRERPEAPREVPPAQTAVAAAPAVTGNTGAAFGTSATGETRGWVVLLRGDAARGAEPNFDGYPVAKDALPPAGTVLKSLHVVQVWQEMLPPGPPDRSKLQGRLASGACVRVMSTRAAAIRQWAEVTPVQCP